MGGGYVSFVCGSGQVSVSHKGIRFALGLFVVACFAYFAYGTYAFADAPIKPCEEHLFCGKQGQPHTEADYQAFNRWETTIFWVWPFCLLAMFLLGKPKRNDT